MITHDGGKRDKRYTFSQEFTGHISGKPRFVARFCGDFIGESGSLSGAVLKAVVFKQIRNGAEIITEHKNESQ